MIPKRIFYVWNGPPLPKSVKRCIASWRKLMPDYKIVEINKASSYFDFDRELSSCLWFKNVFERKLWAYVSDYIRVKTLFDYGGIYFDTDITALKSFDPLLNNVFFAGFESPALVNLAVFGCVAGHHLLHDIYLFYQQEIWDRPIYTIPEITTCVLKEKYGVVLYDSRKIPEAITFGDVTLYPEKSFYPYRYDEVFTKNCVNDITYTIHWWNMSWDEYATLRWLNSKHLSSRYPSPESVSIQEYLRFTPRDLKFEVLLFGRWVFIKGFKQGCCHAYEIFGLPLLTIQWFPDRYICFLFNNIKIISRKK